MTLKLTNGLEERYDNDILGAVSSTSGVALLMHSPMTKKSGEGKWEVTLSQRCLELMVGSLGTNMTRIEDETVRNVDVVDFEGRVKKALPSELQYACLHWASHMMAAEQADETYLSLLKKFTHGRLLNWMEAMSLLGDVPRAILMMRDMHAWAVSGHWLDYAVTDDQLI